MHVILLLKETENFFHLPTCFKLINGLAFLSLINYIQMKDKFIIWLCGLLSAARKNLTDWEQIKALLREDVALHNPL